MKTLRFGIEIETVGQTRQKVAQAIQRVVGGYVFHHGHTYDAWHVSDTRDRTWKVVRDGSLSGPESRKAEVVSPILRYEDLAELQEIVRAVREAGAKVDSSTGIHIHVDAAPFDAKKLRNLVKIVNKQEALIERALGISDSRKNRWCKGVREDFLEKIEREKPGDLNAMNTAWYGRYTPSPYHYHASRYHGLNLHNVWFRGTVEFRWFNGTLHAGKIKTYIQFCLALAAKALKARGANSKKRELKVESSKYDFRVFLLGLGLIGDEFKTARLHLLSNLTGSAAWKNGRRDRTAA